MPTETTPLDASARSSAPGSFIELPDGITHYELSGPTHGQPVVLVHGFSVPYYLWDHTFYALADAGFRVLRYDLFGRGYSDHPDLRYDATLFDRQLVDLLAALQIRLPVDVIGSSMGGVISTIFTDRHPELVRRLALIDPAGLMKGLPFPMSLLELPLLGAWFMEHYGMRALVSGISGDLYHPAAFPEYAAQYTAQMQYPGFRRALLSTLQSHILYHQQDVYRRVGCQNRPILLIWGRQDQTIPLPISAQVRACLPHCTFHLIEDSGHIPHYERPDLVNPLLIDFLNR